MPEYTSYKIEVIKPVNVDEVSEKDNNLNTTFKAKHINYSDYNFDLDSDSDSDTDDYYEDFDYNEDYDESLMDGFEYPEENAFANSTKDFNYESSDIDETEILSNVVYDLLVDNNIYQTVEAS